MQPQANSKLTITPQSLQAKMKLPPQLAQQLQRMIVAGMKVMFSQQTRGLLQKAMAGNGPIAQKIGTGVAGVLGILMKESNNSLPRQLLVPAGMILVAHGAEFAEKAGLPVTDQDVGQAIQVMTTIVLKAHGVDANRVAQVGASGHLPPPKAPAAPGGAPGGADPTGRVSAGPTSPMGAAGVNIGGGM